MKILGSFPKTRLRRIRKSRWIRNLISENNISNNDLVLPIFIREGKNKVDKIKTMPGVSRYSVDRLPSILNQVKKYKFQWWHFSLHPQKLKKRSIRIRSS